MEIDLDVVIHDAFAGAFDLYSADSSIVEGSSSCWSVHRIYRALAS